MSQGAGSPPDYAAAADVAIRWITSHQGGYHREPSNKAHLININAPTCTTGKVRGVKQVPARIKAGSRAVDLTKINCASAAHAPADDVDALLEGYVSITELDRTVDNATPTTAWRG